MYVRTYVCMYVCIYVCMYVCIYVCMYVSMYVCMYECIYLCMYVCICHMNKYTCMCTNNKWHKHLIQIIFCISPCWKWDLKRIWKIFMGLGYPSRAARASIFAGILVDANALKSHNAWRTVRTTTPDCPLSAQRWQISRKNCSAKRLVNATEGKKRTHTHIFFIYSTTSGTGDAISWRWSLHGIRTGN